MYSSSDTQIIDISPPLSEHTAVWPGDTPLRREVLHSLEDGHNFSLSTLHTTVHIGAHADAPSHYDVHGASIDQVDLKPYLGPCYVVSVTNKRALQAAHIERALKTGIPRILIKTQEQYNAEVFREDFSYLTPDLCEAAAKANVVLVGLDTPSVDPFHAKELRCHQLLLKYNIRNLEGLDLKHVDEGRYTLIALPLKLVGFDASPVRAVLLKTSETTLI